MPRSRTAIPYLRRSGAIQTHVAGRPRLAPSDLMIHRLPVAPHQVLPDAMPDANGSPQPDRGRVQVWPILPSGVQS